MAGDKRGLRNEELAMLLSFAEARQRSFLENGNTEAASQCAENDQAIADEMARRGITTESYKKYPVEG